MFKMRFLQEIKKISMVLAIIIFIIISRNETVFAETSIELKTGESCVVVNSSTVEEQIEGSGSVSGYADIVIYNADGSINYQDNAVFVRSKTYKIPAGGKLLSTCVSEKVASFVTQSTNLVFNSTTEKAMVRQKIGFEETFEFVNISSVTAKLEEEGSTNGYADIVVYYKDGSINYQENDLFIGPGTFQVPAGGKLIATCLGENTAQFAGPTTSFSINMSTEKVMIRQKIATGESCEFVNISSKTAKVEGEGAINGYADIVVYNKDGSINYKVDKVYVFVNTFAVPAGGKLVATSVGEANIGFAAPTSKFSIDGSLTPVIIGQTKNIYADLGYEIKQPIGTLNSKGEYVVSNFSSQEFISNGEFDEFQDVYLNEQLLVKDIDYIAVEGSTKITIKSQTIQTKANNNASNTIKATFKNDSGETKQATQVFNLSVPINKQKLTVIYNGETKSYEPIVKNGTSYIKARKLVEETLGGTIKWDGATGQITVLIGENTLVFTEKGTTYYFNGVRKTMVKNPGIFIQSGSTYVPVRFICEAFSMKVEFNSNTNIANIDN